MKFDFFLVRTSCSYAGEDLHCLKNATTHRLKNQGYMVYEKLSLMYVEIIKIYFLKCYPKKSSYQISSLKQF